MFGKSQEDRNAEAEEKMRKALEKYGMDLENYGEGELDRRNAQDLQALSLELMGTKAYTFGSLLPGGSSDTAMILTLLSAQITQNRILMRQNEQIIRLLRGSRGSE